MGFVLVVEDDEELREVLQLVLADEGYTSRAAWNGQVALEMLQADPLPDLIVLDLMMPVMNGWAFRERQLGDARVASVPVIVMTATTGTDESAISATDWVRKPVHLDDFLRRVRKYAAPDRETDAVGMDRDGGVVARLDVSDSSPSR